MQNLSTLWLQRSYAALFFLLPWSIDIFPWGLGMQVPAEPLMVICSLLLLAHLVGTTTHNRGIFQHFWAVLFPPTNISTRLWHHPLALSLLWLIWMGVAAVFSSMPLVSWKYWLVEATHWWVFAFGIALVPGLWQKTLPWLGGSMALFVGYALAHHGQYGFRADQALLSPMPFFPEHTMYAAVLALLLPWSAVMARWFGPNPALAPLKSWVAPLLMSVYVIGLWFADCRAAWLSLVMAVGALLCLYGVHTLGKASAWLVTAGICAGLFFGPFVIPPIAAKCSIQDVSTLERLNRYACARQMVQAKPLMGFGPGTFQFQYLPFQHAEHATRISVTEPILERNADTFGRGGGAHSEYLQSLAETGWPGLVLQWSCLSAVLFGLVRQYEKYQNWAALICWCSLLTFLLHGMVNNFLHDGRIAALVWGAIGYYSSLAAHRHTL